MKRWIFAVIVVAGLHVATFNAQAQKAQTQNTQTQKAQTMTGLITDSMCAQTHQPNIEHARENSGKTMTEKECTVGCVARRGQKYVLVAGDKVYQIANQDYAGLPTFAAEMVTLTARVTGSTITVSTMAAAPNTKK